MSAPKEDSAARGGNAIAHGDDTTAIGGNAGPSGPEVGGRGGDAYARKRNTIVIGGRGGRGGISAGMAGMDVSDDGLGIISIGGTVIGGTGGEAPQPDGRGGRGGSFYLEGLAFTGMRAHMKRPYWPTHEVEYGRGGDGADSLQYRARRLIVELIKAEHLGVSCYLTTDVWYERDAVPAEAINQELSRRKLNWTVDIIDYEYVMIDRVLEMDK